MWACGCGVRVVCGHVVCAWRCIGVKLWVWECEKQAGASPVLAGGKWAHVRGGSNTGGAHRSGGSGARERPEPGLAMQPCGGPARRPCHAARHTRPLPAPARLFPASAPRPQLGECVRSMIYCDYPDKWPQLLQQIYALLTSQASAAGCRLPTCHPRGCTRGGRGRGACARWREQGCRRRGGEARSKRLAPVCPGGGQVVQPAAGGAARRRALAVCPGPARLTHLLCPPTRPPARRTRRASEARCTCCACWPASMSSGTRCGPALWRASLPCHLILT